MGYHYTVEGTTGKILGVGENQAHGGLYPLQRIQVQQMLVDNPPHCRTRHMFDTLYSTNAGMVSSSARFAVLSSTSLSPSSAVSLRRANSADLFRCEVIGVTRACVRKIALRTYPSTSLPLLQRYRGIRHEWNSYGRILGMCSFIFQA
jgi:hypothetical protein